MKIKSIYAYKSDEPVYDIEVNTKDHTFYLDSSDKDSLRISNCRLINNNELFELGGQVNSFGGSALSLGSHRVCTVNMRRISLECSSYEDYKNRLAKRMEDAEKILVAHRSLIKDMIAKGTQPFMDNGWLDLDRMFSTIGILGYYEANEDLKERFGGNDYLEDIVGFIDDVARALTEKYHNVTNVEQIPAEAQAVKAAKTDHWIFDGPDENW